MILVNRMQVQESNLNKRISGTNVEGIAYNGVCICNPIPVDLTKSCPVTFVGFASAFNVYNSTSNFGMSKALLLDENKAVLCSHYIGSIDNDNIWYVTSDGDNYTGNLTTILNKSGAPNASDVAYVIFTLDINNGSAALTMDDLNGMEIRMP